MASEAQRRIFSGADPKNVISSVGRRTMRYATRGTTGGMREYSAVRNREKDLLSRYGGSRNAERIEQAAKRMTSRL